jgi:hypothetical protein
MEVQSKLLKEILSDYAKKLEIITMWITTLLFVVIFETGKFKQLI